MNELSSALLTAVDLLLRLDPELVEIVWRSLLVSLSAVLLAALVGLPFGAAVALFRFPGQGLVVLTLNALMGLPPVVVGLLVYLLLYPPGPLGPLQLLFTPTAMIIAQWLLITPLIAALARRTLADLHEEYAEELCALNVGALAMLATLLWEGRYSLLTALLAGFGRASAEVGAVLIVGGNIAHLTRVMTTAIALETSKGNLALALGLGLILILIAIVINAIVTVIHDAALTRA